ncbi:MAG: chromate transporter [Firmicutes bacterium]|nr:chromate transporter [Bacillota bacterium]
MELLKIFFTFCRIGGLTFGGGVAMLPMLTKEVVERNHWATEEELLDCYAIGQLTPGVIAVNTSTFIGYKQKGVPGAIAATLGMVFPSIVIICIIASILQGFSSNENVQHAFVAIRVAVSALIVDAVIRMGKTSIKNKTGLIAAVIAFAVIAALSASPVYIVIAAFVLGFIKTKKEDAK